MKSRRVRSGKGAVQSVPAAWLQRLRRLIVVRLFYSLHGKRRELLVPFHEARKHARRLLAEGAAIYWSEVV
jgi:hypothetical protein